MSISTLPPAARNAFEQRLPEIVTALRNAALPVHPQRQTRDRRTRLQQRPDRLFAILRVIRRRQPLDPVIHVRTVLELVLMRPEAELEMQPARRRLLRDELERLQIPVALRVRQARWRAP